MEKILQVRDLHTSFLTSNGEVQAVRGVSFDVEKGKTLGIVGESGSGKSVTSLSILKLLGPTGKISAGSIKLDGEELSSKSRKEMRSIRGGRIAMIFQDPMTSLNPLIPLGDQVGEMLWEHKKELSKNGMPRKRSTVKLGEIEDLNPKFVVADVPKRPLNDGTNTKPEAKKDDASVAKSKRIGGRLRSKRAAKLSAKQEKTESKVQKSAEKNETYNVPKSPFINQDKVVKRPLSGKAYQPQNVPAIQPEGKKTNGKPVTIIAKPKKDSRVGMVVTIILTIILGAVAGTVAFLLLPK